jgi:hypothetical protein
MRRPHGTVMRLHDAWAIDEGGWTRSSLRTYSVPQPSPGVAAGAHTCVFQAMAFRTYAVAGAANAGKVAVHQGDAFAIN